MGATTMTVVASGVQDLMKTHNFSIRVDLGHPVSQEEALQGLACTLASRLAI